MVKEGKAPKVDLPRMRVAHTHLARQSRYRSSTDICDTVAVRETGFRELAPGKDIMSLSYQTRLLNHPEPRTSSFPTSEENLFGNK